MSRKQKVLAVDDEAFNLDIIEADLNDAGFEVVRATDGIIALQKLEEDLNIDIILLDRMMPQMDGMEVLKKVKSTPRICTIPVILQSADGRNQQIAEGLRAGACQYLIKPYDEKQLVDAITVSLAQSDHALVPQ